MFITLTPNYPQINPSCQLAVKLMISSTLSDNFIPFYTSLTVCNHMIMVNTHTAIVHNTRPKTHCLDATATMSIVGTGCMDT